MWLTSVPVQVVVHVGRPSSMAEGKGESGGATERGLSLEGTKQRRGVGGVRRGCSN